jgi:hypothetical protein
MSNKGDEAGIKELDEVFDLLGTPAQMRRVHEVVRPDDKEWKNKDPESYKKDMEEMCKAMFGENWKAEYELMIKEEFPEEQ